MATGGYDKEEYRKQMSLLEQQFEKLGQDNTGGQGQENKSKDSPVKPQLNSQETFHETSEYQFCESRHRTPKPDDEKDFFISQVKAVTAALSVPLSSVITPFEGGPRKFKQWLKEVEKYAVMSGKANHEIPMLAYITSKGSVGDFINRYLDET